MTPRWGSSQALCTIAIQQVMITDGYGFESFPGLPGAPSPRALKPRLRYKFNHGVMIAETRDLAFTVGLDFVQSTV